MYLNYLFTFQESFPSLSYKFILSSLPLGHWHALSFQLLFPCSFELFFIAGPLSTAEEHMSTRISQNSATKAETTVRGGEQRLLQAAIIDVVATALKSIDLSHHSGSHPRLGVVDHICLHPLGTATLTDTATTAQGIASEIGSVLKGAFLLICCNP